MPTCVRFISAQSSTSQKVVHEPPHAPGSGVGVSGLGVLVGVGVSVGGGGTGVSGPVEINRLTGVDFSSSVSGSGSVRTTRFAAIWSLASSRTRPISRSLATSVPSASASVRPRTSGMVTVDALLSIKMTTAITASTPTMIGIIQKGNFLGGGAGAGTAMVAVGPSVTPSSVLATSTILKRNV